MLGPVKLIALQVALSINDIPGAFIYPLNIKPHTVYTLPIIKSSLIQSQQPSSAVK